MVVASTNNRFIPGVALPKTGPRPLAAPGKLEMLDSDTLRLIRISTSEAKMIRASNRITGTCRSRRARLRLSAISVWK